MAPGSEWCSDSEMLGSPLGKEWQKPIADVQRVTALPSYPFVIIAGSLIQYLA